MASKIAKLASGKLTTTIIALIIVGGIMLGAGILGVGYYVACPAPIPITNTITKLMVLPNVSVVTITETMVTTVKEPPQIIKDTVTVNYWTTRTITMIRYQPITLTSTKIIERPIVVTTVVYTPKKPSPTECVDWRSSLKACSFLKAYELHRMLNRSLVNMFGELPDEPYLALVEATMRVSRRLTYSSMPSILIRIPEEILSNGVADYIDYAILIASYLLDAGYPRVAFYIYNIGLGVKPLVVAGLEIGNEDYIASWWSPGSLITAQELCLLLASMLNASIGYSKIVVEKIGDYMQATSIYGATCSSGGVYVKPSQEYLQSLSRLVVSLLGLRYSDSELLLYASSEVTNYTTLSTITRYILKEVTEDYMSTYIEVFSPWYRVKPLYIMAAVIADALKNLIPREMSVVSSNSIVVEKYYRLPGVGAVKAPVIRLGLIAIKPKQVPPPETISEAEKSVNELIKREGVLVNSSLADVLYRFRIDVEELLAKGYLEDVVDGYKVYARIVDVSYTIDPGELAREIFTEVRKVLRHARQAYIGLRVIGVDELPLLLALIAYN